jgi:hypothetical protein
MSSLRDNLSREPPEVLYKYRSWTDHYHKRLLTDNEAFFASPRAFNDPFDCRIPLRYDLLPDEDKLQLCIREAEARHPSSSREEINQWAHELMRDSAFSDPCRMRAVQEHWQQTIFSNFGVFSLSEVSDDILMWAHYAESHKGFCVGFDVPQLAMQGERWREDGLLTHAHPVVYSRTYPAVIPRGPGNHDDLKEVLLTKSQEWEYEREWRVLLFMQTNRSAAFNDCILAEIILGCSMAEDHKEEIIEIIRRKSHPIPVCQAKRKENEFGLDLELLNL